MLGWYKDGDELALERRAISIKEVEAEYGNRGTHINIVDESENRGHGSDSCCDNQNVSVACPSTILFHGVVICQCTIPHFTTVYSS